MVSLPAAHCTHHHLDEPRRSLIKERVVLEIATVRGRDWYTLLDAPVLTLGVTV
jgi:hypothetical protein